MASVEQIKEFSTLGREIGLSGGGLSSFVSERCQAVEREREREHELKLAQLRKDEGNNVAQLGGVKLVVGQFDDAHDKFDAYITKFEMILKSQKIPNDVWVLHLISNLKGKALDVVNRMSTDDRQKYTVVKSELMQSYNLTEEGYRRSFRSVRPLNSERPKQFANRMKGHFDNWIGASKIDNSRAAFEDLMLREQFLIDCPKEVARFIGERKCTKFDEAVECAEVYVSAHGPHVFFGGEESERSRSDPEGGSKGPNQVDKTNAKLGEVQARAKKVEGSKPFQKKGCYMCGNPNHMKRECPLLVKSMAAQGMMLLGGDEVPGVDAVHNKPNEGEIESEAVELTAACIAEWVVDSEVIEEVGMAYDDIEAMVNDMPVVSGRLMPGNVPVSVLRDSGCSTCVVREALVRKEQFTGRHVRVRLIDETIRRFPLARIVVDSPYFEGEVVAVCMPKCLNDVIIGNVRGARPPKEPNIHWVPKADIEVTPEVVPEVTGLEDSKLENHLSYNRLNVMLVGS
ncbi:uncharacterized protein LOC115928193 [Strongylocentrotus purpuratus]|uniref:CCHC-type domain-containing protein n=1 Tax=Strongylocentrotus purpuratus TaxID=7668 RepID=A0A7M7PHE2_STRPU|nr:uncharacterized protein LOC115928193 [Strongylocentrotus purpuratus]